MKTNTTDKARRKRIKGRDRKRRVTELTSPQNAATHKIKLYPTNATQRQLSNNFIDMRSATGKFLARHRDMIENLLNKSPNYYEAQLIDEHAIVTLLTKMSWQDIQDNGLTTDEDNVRNVVDALLKFQKRAMEIAEALELRKSHFTNSLDDILKWRI